MNKLSKNQSTVDAILYNAADNLRKSNPKSIDSIVLNIPSVLVDSSLVWFSSLFASLLSLLELSNFEKLSLISYSTVFNHWTVKLPCCFVQSTRL